MAGETSRINGARIRGPRTAEGKACSRRNARRHGLRGPPPPAVRRSATLLAQACAAAVMVEAGWSTRDGEREGARSPAPVHPGIGGPAGIGGRTGIDIPAELLAPCIAFVEADWAIRRVQAMKAVLLQGTCAAIDVANFFETAWHEIVATATRLNDEARAADEEPPVCDVALLMALQTEALDGVGVLARAARAGRRRGVLLVPLRQRDGTAHAGDGGPDGDALPAADHLGTPSAAFDPDPASIATASAADLATLSGYEQRFASRARRARRAIDGWLSDNSSSPLQGRRPRREDRRAAATDALVAAIAAGLETPEPDRTLRRRREERRARSQHHLEALPPATSRFGLAVRALCWDHVLDDAIGALLAAALDALALDDATRCRRFTGLARIALARLASWRETVFALADIAHFGELHEIAAKRRQVQEAYRRVLQTLEDLPAAVRRREAQRRAAEKNGANEPGGNGEGVSVGGAVAGDVEDADEGGDEGLGARPARGSRGGARPVDD